MPLYTGYLSDLHKKFQVASTYDKNAEFQIWSFCHNLFFSFAAREVHTGRQTNH